MRTLVVDDNPMITELLMINMKYLGHEVDKADDGQDAVDLLEERQYDVVITDGYMPKMTGFDLCRFIRSKYPSTYIIGVTGSTNLKEFAEAGANACFPKPFRFSRLQQAIEGHFGSLPQRRDH
ncbi:MAG: response regulator [Syntrophales bacterium]|nr:response regulator [Syntrophales bacterium]